MVSTTDGTDAEFLQTIMDSRRRVTRDRLVGRIGYKLLDIADRFLFEWRAFVALSDAPLVCVIGDEGGQMPPPTDPFYAGLGQALRVGTEVLASLIIGGGLGWAADTYLFNSSPWGMVAGLVLGVAGGVRNAYRAAQRWPS